MASDSTIEALQGELERLFELEELLALSTDILGFAPGAIGGTTSKGAFARSLAGHCAAHEAVDALVDVLGRLGRDMELFALLSARWEDATPEEREAMVPKQRAVLARLAQTAEDQGRVLEAQLFRDALSMLPA